MINETNKEYGRVRSVIRDLFEYGNKRKNEIGKENVFDFSIGNPSVPAPKCVEETLVDLIKNTDPVILHGYSSAQGNFETRRLLADFTNKRFSTNLDADCFYLTCGAAASLTITLNALLNRGDEVLTFAPFFPEYNVFVSNAGGKLVGLKSDEKNFQIDFEVLEKSINEKTKAVIINSPNNPSGVVYNKSNIESLCEILKKNEKKFGHEIFLISDEPYRELVFDKETEVPYVMNFYENSIVCYSYSKSLSLPGERIGYIAVNNQMKCFKDVYSAVCGAGRALGFVCAPTLFQLLIQKVYDKTADISVYKKNRDILCEALSSFGYHVIKPDGAFYLFVKALEEDAKAFSERAKDFELLLVPSDSFGVKGYVRISYCVDQNMILKSLEAFKKLAESYKK